MCGRYTLTRQERLIEEFEASLGDVENSEWWKARYNVAPTQPAPVVILRDGARLLEMMRWGLVPFWAGKGAGPAKKPPLMINARTESLKSKAVFRDALERRRCLVPADGFYEWKRDGKHAQPMYMHEASGRPFAFAGLWAKAKTDAGDLLSFTIITGPPNDLVKPVHDRMPVVLAREAYAAWLDPAVDADAARALLSLPPHEGWVREPVSMHVNSAQHDDESCVLPITLEDDAPTQRSLF